MSGTAVLLSGGLDSAVLLADEAVQHGARHVQPVYVAAGLAWEAAERTTIARLLATPPFAALRPLASLSVDMRDVYAASHWAVRGAPPAYHTPDEDVYLPGRNIILLGKAAVFCAVADLSRIVLGTLAHNPFPDATDEFRDALARALSLGLAHEIAIAAPFAGKSKADVTRRGLELGIDLTLTLSCMNPQVHGVHKVHGVHGVPEPDEPNAPHEPVEPVHCGTCSKCRERHDAFLELGITDPTEYADQRFVSA